MTKETYFEMCEALGTTPVESEIPVEFVDLPAEMQEILEIYRLMKDDWDAVGGNYLGKNFLGILDIFNIMDVDPADRKVYLSLLHLVDSVRAEQIKKSKPSD